MRNKNMNVVVAAKTTYLFASALLLILGATMLILKPTELMLRIMIGVCFLLIGGNKIFGYFSNDLYKLAFQFDLALGVLTLIVGLVLLIRGNITMQTMASIIGIYVVADGLFKMQTAIDAKRFGMKKWVTIFVAAIVVGLTGALALFDPFVGFASVGTLTLMGVSLILCGALNIWTTAYTVRVKAKKKHAEDKYDSL